MKQKKRKTNVSFFDRRRESESLKKRLNTKLHEKLNEHRKQQKPRNVSDTRLKRRRNACKLKIPEKGRLSLRKERSK
jgi:hypothetical protein